MPPRGNALYCTRCGFDLRCQTEPRCPECAQPFDRQQLAHDNREEVLPPLRLLARLGVPAALLSASLACARLGMFVVPLALLGSSVAVAIWNVVALVPRLPFVTWVRRRRHRPGTDITAGFVAVAVAALAGVQAVLAAPAALVWYGILWRW